MRLKGRTWSLKIGRNEEYDCSQVSFKWGGSAHPDGLYLYRRWVSASVRWPVIRRLKSHGRLSLPKFWFKSGYAWPDASRTPQLVAHEG